MGVVKVPSVDKEERVAAMKSRIEGSPAMLLAEYRGLTVSEIMELRRSLREADTSFAVVKNTLMRLAVSQAGREELQGFLTGPSAVAFIAGDPVSAAKKLAAVAKQHPSLVVKGGWMDGRLLSADEARALADLESREVMLSRIAGMLKSEMSRAASMFQAVQSRFLSVLAAYEEKRSADAPEVQETPVPEVPEPEIPEPEITEPEITDPPEGQPEEGDR